jgi:hypothetical protein
MKKNAFTQLGILEKSTRQLAKWIKTGRYKSLSFKKRQQLTRRIERMQRNLSLFASSKRVKRAFATATVVLGLAINPMNAQSFEFKTPNTSSPMGLGASGDIAFPAFGDLDGDGDIDLLVGESGNYTSLFKYYKNNGTSTVPNFGTSQTSPFGLAAPTSYFISPVLVDIDDDGDLDIFASSYYGIDYYENTGTATAPMFAAPDTANPFGINSIYNTSIDFADMDDDGDLDVFLGDLYNDGEIQYFENTGTVTAPVFTNFQVNPFGLVDLYSYSIVRIIDIDKDGDYDIIGTEEYGIFQYFENIGSKTVPNFAAPVANAFGLAPLSGADVVLHDFADMDNDGDEDILMGGYTGYGNLFGYQENNAIPVSADAMVTTIKNVDYTFEASDFAFTDADNSAATDVVITGLPTKGTLNLGGTAVALNDTIPVSVIPSLTFSPVADSLGVPYDSLEFRVSDGYSLSAAQMITIEVQVPVSTNGVLATANLAIAPNPVSNLLNINLQLAEPIQTAEVLILDYTGKIVHSEALDNLNGLRVEQQIAVNHLPNGIYILKIATDNGQLVRRFVKQ